MLGALAGAAAGALAALVPPPSLELLDPPESPPEPPEPPPEPPDAGFPSVDVLPPFDSSFFPGFTDE